MLWLVIKMCSCLFCMCVIVCVFMEALSFYRASIESILTYCISIWYASCTVAQKKALQGVINAAQRIIGCPLLKLEDLHSSRCLKRAHNIIKDISHPGHSMFELLPSGKRYRTIYTRTNRLKHSFYPIAISCLNATKSRWRSLPLLLFMPRCWNVLNMFCWIR